jgi:arylsulfatase A-like enzyme
VTRLRPLRPLLVLSATVVGGSAAFIAAYRAWFALPGAVVSAHVALVAGVLVVALLAAAALQVAARRRTRLVVAPLAVVVVTLALLDAVSWVARAVWMDQLSLDTILVYAPRIWDVAAGATQVRGGLLLAAVGLGGLAVLAVVLWFARPVADAVFRAVADPDGPALFGRTRPGAWSVVALVAGAAVVGAGFRTLGQRSDLRGEPLAGLVPRPRARIEPVDRPAPASLLRAGANAALGQADAPAAVSVVPGRKNVVIVIIDSLRPDHVSSAGYRRMTTPALDAFVASGPAIVAQWATSACSISECGIMSILGSAQYWRQHARLPTLPDVLEAAGYDLYFASSGDFTRGYPFLRDLVAAKARMFVDGFRSDRWAPNDDRHVVDALSDIPAFAGRPAFFYFHLHSMHLGGAKYRDPTYRPSVRDSGVFAALTNPNRDENVPIVDDHTAEMRLNDYDNAALQADEVLARILATLRERGYLDESVVVVTSDHGEALGERGKWGHGHDLYAVSIDVPLIIRDPTLGGTRRVPYAGHVDVAPTVAACLGLDPPASWEGRSLLDGVPSDSFHQTTHPQPILAVVWRTVRGTYKYVFDTKSRAEALYELGSDPREEVDVLARTDPAIVSALKAALADNFATVLSAPAAPAK